MVDFFRLQWSPGVVQMRGTSRRLSKITEFSKFVAEKDYTGENLDVISRDEFGLLVNDLNSFQTGTKELLKEVVCTQFQGAFFYTHAIIKTCTALQSAKMKK